MQTIYYGKLLRMERGPGAGRAFELYCRSDLSECGRAGAQARGECHRHGAQRRPRRLGEALAGSIILLFPEGHTAGIRQHIVLSD